MIRINVLIPCLKRGTIAIHRFDFILTNLNQTIATLNFAFQNVIPQSQKHKCKKCSGREEYESCVYENQVIINQDQRRYKEDESHQRQIFLFLRKFCSFYFNRFYLLFVLLPNMNHIFYFGFLYVFKNRLLLQTGNAFYFRPSKVQRDSQLLAHTMNKRIVPWDYQTKQHRLFLRN